MAITNGYTTLAVMKTNLGIPTTDTDDDDRIEAAVTTASRQIDTHCDREFFTTEATRVFDAWDSATVYVDDISTDSGLVVKIDTDDDGTFATTLTATTDFILRPHNEYPAEEIVLVDNYSFPTGRRPGVQVAATFGYPSVPADVVEACKIQAKNLYKVAGSGVFGSMQISVDGIPMRIPALDYVAVGLLVPYRKTVIG